LEMNIGTGGSGNPVLAVQCNYEKNYAFIEVNKKFPMLRMLSHSSINSSVVPKMPPPPWHSMASFS
jgi:hypothetical protein